MGLPERRRVDWAAPVKAGYRRQLTSHAADLVQLFPGAAYSKDGADTRLAVDAVEDMFRPRPRPNPTARNSARCRPRR